MFPALDAELKQETLPDPYEDFMHHHLQYYGYFKAQKGNLPNSAAHQRVWKTSPRYMLNGSFGERDNLISDTLEKETFLYSLMLSSPLLRSRQLLCDELDEVNPRLREPRELLPFFSGRGPLQAPRWPIECEVIREDIHHIEWVPPQPEYFYQPTGDEKMPEVVGEEQGTVVYQLDSVPTDGAYFTSSRIGGKRGIIKELAVTLQGPEDNTLLFESRFESGNLQKAVRVGVYEYELTLRTDLYTDKHTQWFYFRVQNTRKDVTYRFTIVNLLKPKSLYAVGMKPLMYSQLDAATYNVGWRREGQEIKYYKNNTGDGQQPFYCLTWTLQFPHDQDTCFFAHFYPYTYTDLQCYLLSIANNPIQSQFCKLRALCRSLAGNTVYLLTITSPSRTPQEAATKKAVVLSARVHPGESNGSWIMRGFLDFILGNSPDAQLLRDIFVFKVIPMLNPDGVIVGNYRCSLAGRDLNRHYKTVLKDSFPCIWYTKNMIKRLLEEREVLLYCDFHGHSRKNNIFLYGCNSNSRKHWLHERVFPLMLSKNAPDKFSFDSCNFKVQKCKEGTGRVVMWRMGITNSYTMESTFGGSTLGSKRDTHFTTEDLKSLGYHVCDTILDFCDPDQTKYTQCLQELKELLQQEIHKKFNNSGQEMDLEGSWSDFPLSDIESSTSGSDSSLSGGLPAHLLSMADEEQLNQKMVLMKPKKKRLQTRKQRNEQHQNYLMRELKLTEDTPTELSGRDKGTSLDPPLTSLVLPKNKEIIQSKKPGFTSCSPKRSTNSSLGPAPDVKPNWPRTKYPATRKDRTSTAVYPSLHIYTYP
ncbi:cytosolic carboxypeptidase 2 isoform X1 [Alexandromys fortis]|uniref:cytosolic carboxypeptidase 2 isoform X1 n=2 Tax=Alexandromys fortis TaxID=100897 RepID=UPI0021537C36|nr:cytosolic carboxypeptidase 2 isoform X1 [Microtus fortis]XP_049980264.1 cytosolic carboxypeptidase 2 isoform X1 [Microtus fortis]XP_049980265.1 cytosolic carboxypeptidase 2 isoform X1 [Microtus fortis]XP_049980266.1 cytosolic carboxypeptidase 2 isoform X1 [Microtus fortis]XP_049980267.1 cytosolic carboxypeptidase 2 isoform X1 [Microtus fortis]